MEVCENILPKSHFKMLNIASTSLITALIRARTLKMSSITKPFGKRRASCPSRKIFFLMQFFFNLYLNKPLIIQGYGAVCIELNRPKLLLRGVKKCILLAQIKGKYHGFRPLKYRSTTFLSNWFS